jgi:2',3'-cyclic-nucleotide 2'-phosphodiesterase/3'-nucleotidase
MKKSCFIWLTILSVLLAALSFPAALAAENTHIVILCTSDMHANVWGWSYEDGTETSNNGMARLYSCIRQVREENPLVFLIDGGDDIQGTILSDDIANKEPDQPHPVMAAMNYMGYDSMTLGNHEFNWGVPTLLKIIGQADFPVLAQNIRTPDGNLLTHAGWVIIERGGIKLAVIGVVTPMIPLWDSGKAGIDDLICEDAAAAVREAIDEIGDQADIIMVSAHMGLYAEYDEEGGSDSALKILDNNPEVDILQVGHQHITVNEKVGRVPVGGVRNAGREIARFDLTVDSDRKIISSEVTIVDMADYEPDSELRELPAVRLDHDRAVALVGVSPEGSEPSGPPLGVTTARFQPENEIRGIPEGRLRDTAVIDLILKVELENSGADVASASLFRDTSDLPEGEIRYEDIFNIYKFDNFLYRVTVTGAELKQYMEWSAECYNQWNPGDINISFDPDYPGYLYDMFGGITYEINLSMPKGKRIENVMFKSRPLRDDDVLTLAVSNFRYSSALKAQRIVAGKPEWESANSVRDMLVDYFGRNSPVEPETDGNWRITGVDLGLEDPRRAELINYINKGLLPVPYSKSYNLADYDSLAELAGH